MATIIPLKPIPDEQRLLTKILENYNPAARPVYNASDKVTVKFGLTLIQISDMDEVNQVLTTNVWLEQQWVDERLVWDPADYNGLAVIRIPCNLIWLPDIVLYNNADDYITGYMQSRAMVHSDGTVFWPPPAKIRSSCKIDITFFPFDDQKCKLKFGSWVYDGFQVDMVKNTDEVDLNNYVHSGEWDLNTIKGVRNVKRYACCPEPFPDVTFTIVMSRRTLYYLFNIIFPCLWLTLLSLLSFWLPPDSGEKITLGITVLLAFSVFMLLIAENMPATSEFVPLIGIYLTTTMGMTSLSIMLTVVVLQIHHVGPHQKPVPKWVKSFVLNFVSRLVCMRSNVMAMRRSKTKKGYKDEQMYLTSFMEQLEPECNGNVKPNHIKHNYHDPHVEYGEREQFSGAQRERLLDESFEFDRHRREYKSEAYEKLFGHVKSLVDKQEQDLDHQDIVNDWRLIALIMDRLLFWIFFLVSTLSSICILVVMPLYKADLGI